MSRKEKIEQILREALSALYVEVKDGSALHAGHAGAASGGGHYRVTIVSPMFEGKRLIEQHRMVYQALAREMQKDIHALALNTLTPSQWKSK